MISEMKLLGFAISRQNRNWHSENEMFSWTKTVYWYWYLSQQKMNLGDQWNCDGGGIEIQQLTMSQHLFRFFLRCTRFDDKTTPPLKGLLDKLVSRGDLFETFVERCDLSRIILWQSAETSLSTNDVFILQGTNIGLKIYHVSVSNYGLHQPK